MILLKIRVKNLRLLKNASFSRGHFPQGSIFSWPLQLAGLTGLRPVARLQHGVPQAWRMRMKNGVWLGPVILQMVPPKRSHKCHHVTRRAPALQVRMLATKTGEVRFEDPHAAGNALSLDGQQYKGYNVKVQAWPGGGSRHHCVEAVSVQFFPTPLPQ